MPPVIKKALRNRWFVAGVHAGLWLLLYLALTNLGGKAPDFREADAAANPPQSPAPVAGLERLFSPGVWPKIARSKRTRLILSLPATLSRRTRRRPPPARSK